MVYLCDLLGDSIQVGIKKGLLNLPGNADTPIICVGPGTGIAPMRSVIEQRIDAGAHRKDFTPRFIPHILILNFPSECLIFWMSVVFQRSALWG